MLSLQQLDTQKGQNVTKIGQNQGKTARNARKITKINRYTTKLPCSYINSVLSCLRKYSGYINEKFDRQKAPIAEFNAVLGKTVTQKARLNCGMR